MRNFTKILEETLEKVTEIDRLDLAEETPINATEEDKERLLSRLDKELKFINKIIIAIIILHFLLFIIVVYFVFYYQDSINTVLLLLGGSGCSLMVIIYSLTCLLRTKNAIDLIRIFLPLQPPNEAMKTIEKIYFKAKKDKWC